MERKIINTNVRFNLAREEDCRAYEHLRGMDRKQIVRTARLLSRPSTLSSGKSKKRRLTTNMKVQSRINRQRWTFWMGSDLLSASVWIGSKGRA